MVPHRDRPTGQRGFAPLARGPGDAPVPGLPVYRGRLIGRGDDHARLRDLLLVRRHRLVVVIGPGGVGKTRLAVEVATTLAPRYRHGARLLPLASVTPGADLDAVVAWHLGLQDIHHQSYRDSIAEHLADREMLLVVDDGEQAPGMTDLISFIHGACPAVSLLVTSRRTLDIYGEVVHEVLPLPHHSPGRAALAAGIGIESLRHSPSVDLLRDRVRALNPAFEVTEANAADIAAVCERLGGLPLAIELTAPHLASRDAATLLADLPAGGMAPSRVDAALRRTVRLGYQQLDAVQQPVFRALCIMRGAWSVDDVLPMLPGGDEYDAIDHIDALVRRSLIASATMHGEVRFTINPALRHVGRRLLEERGETLAIAGRHARRMLEIAETAEPELTGPEQPWWLARLASLHDDLRAAHAHLLAHDRAVEALRLAAALWRYAFTRGHYREGRRTIEAALAHVGAHDALRSHALNGVGLLAARLRDDEGARAAHGRALALATPLGLQREIAVAHISLARLDAAVSGDMDGALRHLRRAEAMYQQLRDTRGLAVVLTHRGDIACRQGRLDAAFATHEEAGMLYARVGDTGGIAWARTHTGRIAAGQGRFHDATSRLLAALDGYVQLGDVNGIAEVLQALAAVAASTGQETRASELLGAAAATRAGTGSTLTGLEFAGREAPLTTAREAPGHGAAYARGATLAIAEAIAMARAFSVPGAPRERDATDARELAHARFGITTREHEVLTLLVEGLSSQEVADRLGLSVRTVHAHTASLMRKLDVHSRIAVARVAHQAGIIAARPQGPPAGRGAAPTRVAGLHHSRPPDAVR